MPRKYQPGLHGHEEGYYLLYTGPDTDQMGPFGMLSSGDEIFLPLEAWEDTDRTNFTIQGHGAANYERLNGEVPHPQNTNGVTPGALTIKDEGSTIGSLDTLDFVGAGVTVTDAGSGAGTVTIAGGGGITSYADYTELKADTADDQIVFVEGFRGGIFYRDAADATSVDNGATILVRGDNVRYKRQSSHRYSVKMWGATGDGITDDTAALAEAMASGHSLWIPNGTYRTSEPLNFYTSGQQVIGESENSTKIVVTANVSAVIIKQTNNTFWPYATGTSAGSQQNGVLANMRFVYTGGVTSTEEGFTVEPNVLSSNYTIESFEVLNCHMEGWNIGWEVQYASKMKFSNVNVKNALSKGFYIHGATNNCPEFHHIHVNGGSNGTPIGVHIDGMNGGIVTLGDFALTTQIGVKIENSQLTISGGELESYDSVTPTNPSGTPGSPGCFFEITNSKVVVTACRFLSGYGVPIKVGANSSVNVLGNSWSPTNTGHADYINALVSHTATSSVVFGFNGGLWGAGNLGDISYNRINRQRHADGVTFSQIDYVMKSQSRRETDHFYTVTDDWLGVLQQEPYISPQQPSTLVTWGKNGDGGYYKTDLGRLNMRRKDYGNGSDTMVGWEGLIMKDGGTLILRDPASTYFQAEVNNPYTLLVHNYGSTDLAVNRHLVLSAVTTINGVQANVTIPPKGSAWFITTGADDAWTMIKGWDPAAVETVSNKSIDTSANFMKVKTVAHNTSTTLSAANCYGSLVVATDDVTLTLPAGVEGMSLTVTTRGAKTVSVKAGAGDYIVLDGAILDNGDKVTNTGTSGDTIYLVASSTGDWNAMSDGWSDTGA